MLNSDQPKKVRSKGYRVTPSAVRRNLQSLESSNLTSPPELGPDLVMLAGCMEVLPGVDTASVESVSALVHLILEEDYVAGFRDGFNYSSTSKRVSRRYLEGLEDGGQVGGLFRQYRRLGTET